MFASLTLALSLAGCSAPFATEGEELSYLSSLSNPTPEQWQRRKELQAKADTLRYEHEERERPAREAEAARAKAKAKAEAEERGRALTWAAGLEGTGPSFGARGAYKDIIARWPDSPEAAFARGRLDELLKRNP